MVTSKVVPTLQPTGPTRPHGASQRVSARNLDKLAHPPTQPGITELAFCKLHRLDPADAWQGAAADAPQRFGLFVLFEDVAPLVIDCLQASHVSHTGKDFSLSDDHSVLNADDNLMCSLRH